MEMRALSEAEIGALRLCDATLVRIEWIGSESPNLRIVLTRSGLIDSLLFTWVNRLRIDLKTSQTFNAMTWDVLFNQVPDGRWQVQFDFASGGDIEFECEAIMAERIN